MRAFAFLAIVALLAGCTVRVASSENGVTVDETIFEDSVPLPPPANAGPFDVVVPANATEVRMRVETSTSVNLRVEGCGRDSSGAQISVNGASAITANCGAMAAGTHTFTLRRDAGQGDAHVVVTASLRRVQ